MNGSEDDVDEDANERGVGDRGVFFIQRSFEKRDENRKRSTPVPSSTRMRLGYLSPSGRWRIQLWKLMKP